MHVIWLKYVLAKYLKDNVLMNHAWQKLPKPQRTPQRTHFCTEKCLKNIQNIEFSKGLLYRLRIWLEQ